MSPSACPACGPRRAASWCDRWRRRCRGLSKLRAAARAPAARAAIAIGAGALVIAAVAIAAVAGVRYNTSGSLPRDLYLLRATPPGRMDLVLVCPPAAAARRSIRRYGTRLVSRRRAAARQAAGGRGGRRRRAAVAGRPAWAGAWCRHRGRCRPTPRAGRCGTPPSGTPSCAGRGLALRAPSRSDSRYFGPAATGALRGTLSRCGWRARTPPPASPPAPSERSTPAPTRPKPCPPHLRLHLHVHLRGGWARWRNRRPGASRSAIAATRRARPPASLWRPCTGCRRTNRAAAHRRRRRGGRAGGADLGAALLAASCVLAARWRWLAPLGPPWLRLPSYPQPRLLAIAAASTLALAWLAARPQWRLGAAPGLPLVLTLWLAAVTPLYPPLAVRWGVRYGGRPALAPTCAWRGRCWAAPRQRLPRRVAGAGLGAAAPHAG